MDKKQDYLKGILVIIVLCLLGLVTWFNVKITMLEKENYISISGKNSDRLNSLISAKAVEGRYFNDIELQDAVTKKRFLINYEKPTLILLLSNFGCSPCQKRELQNFSTIYDEYSKHLNVAAIFDSQDYEDILKLKKVFSLKYPLFITDGAIVSKYSFSAKYPQMLLIIKNQIVSSFLPLPDDDEFSKWYLSNIIKSIPFLTASAM